ncbi:hypothetical protein B0H13DRAFT_2344825 [Mycena leptocephala]|nr:hypothetical protein B0H13DRAFT_2344825 [Mycena leptocephala]
MKLLTKAQIAAKKLDKAHDAHFAAFPVVITTWRYMPTTMENTIETYPKP